MLLIATATWNRQLIVSQHAYLHGIHHPMSRSVLSTRMMKASMVCMLSDSQLTAPRQGHAYHPQGVALPCMF